MRLKGPPPPTPPRPRRHRYPTRWNLRRHTSPSSHPQAPRLEDKSKNQVLVPCKRKREESHTIYVPREIIFNILLVVPADALHGVLRYVCKQWYNIVNDPEFIRAHCQLSSAACHITQNPNKLHQVSYIEEVADRLKVTEIQIPFYARLYGSLNGLILLLDMTNPEILHVMNLVTKVKLSLPPAVGLTRIKGSVGFAITSSGHYKVVHLPLNEGLSVEVQLRVFTIGIDKAWRSIGVHGIPWYSYGHHTLSCTPYLIAGFWYWFSGNFVCFALDVNTETIYQFSKPENFFTKLNMVSFISLGASLGLTKVEEGIWRIWKLTDVKTGEWAEMARINILEMMSKVDKLFYPITLVVGVALMLIDGEFWFYRRVDEGHIVVRYNLTNGSFVFSPIMRVMDRPLLHPHVHTLLSPKKCYLGIM